jgi:hypothetical protein
MESLFIIVSGGTTTTGSITASTSVFNHPFFEASVLFNSCLSQYDSCCCIYLCYRLMQKMKLMMKELHSHPYYFVKCWNFVGHCSIEEFLSTELYFAHGTPYPMPKNPFCPLPSRLYLLLKQCPYNVKNLCTNNWHTWKDLMVHQLQKPANRTLMIIF